MKKSIKRIALSLLLVLATIVCCIFGASAFRSENNVIAEAASATQTDVEIKVDKTMAAPGDTIKFSVTITSGQGSSMFWEAVNLVITPFDSNNQPSKTLASYFEIDTSFGMYAEPFDYYVDPDSYDGGVLGYTSPFLDFDEEEFNYAYTYDEYCSYQDNPSSTDNLGFTVAVVQNDKSDRVSADQQFTFDFWLKVKSDAPNVSSIKFGLIENNNNSLAFSNAAGANKVTHVVKMGNTANIKCNTVSIRLGDISHDADLKTLKAGHGTASDNITVAENMTYTSTSADKTNFKLIPTADAAAKIEYGSGASDPTVNKTAKSGDTLTIPLDDSGVTVVKFKITAEDGSTVKNYKLTITSAHARLSALTAAIVRPTGAPTVSGTALTPNFAEGTFEYTMKVPSDFTSVDLTPTIKTGYGATGGAITATNCTSSAATLASGTKISVTDVKDGSTVELTVTAKDGTTSQVYKITFSLADVDVSIQSMTMTESGSTVNNDAAQATAKSVDYYFELHEASQYKGTFNITTTSSAATVTIDGAAYSASTQYGTKSSYTVRVTAPAGNYKDYKVMVAQYVERGDFRDLKYSLDGGADQDVVSDPGYNADTRTLTLQLDPAQYVGKRFTVKGTATAGANVTMTGGLSGSGPWTYSSLKAGKNEFTLTATAAGLGGNTYTFVINLTEGKNGFDNVVLKGSANNDLPDFSFNASQLVYNIELPYAGGYDYLNMTFTTDGVLSVVSVIVDTKNAVNAQHTTGSNTHTYGSQQTTQLVAGKTTVIKFYATDDGGVKGDEYTLNITRKAADTNSKLASLDVTINGEAITEWDDGVYFDPDTLTYTYTTELSVGTAAKINIKATPAEDTSKVAGGAGTTIGEQDNSWTVASGGKTYTIVVTAEDGKTKTTYTINIKKVVVGADFTEINAYPQNGSSEAILDNFEGAGTSSSPKKYTLNYNLTDVAVGDKFYIQVTLNSPDATAKVNSTTGLTIKDDTFEFSSLKYGNNVLKFYADSSAGKTYYELTVILAEDLNDIQDIVLKDSKGTAIDGFSFSTGTYYYEVSVPFSVSALTATITREGDYEYIFWGVDGATPARITNFTQNINGLQPGKDKTIVVYGKANNGAGDDGEKYTIVITREEGNSNATLADLTVTIDNKPVAFDEGDFDPFTFEYTIHYEPTGSATSASVDIQATPPEGGSVSGTGKKTFQIKNETTTATYDIVVTAESGDKQTYTVTVIREVIPGDFETLEFSRTGNANDYEDVLTSANYDRFDKKYTLNLTLDEVSGSPSISIRATATKGAKVTYTGGLRASGNEYSAPIKTGVNTFTLTATSNSGTTYTFEISLYEEKNDIDKIEITSAGKPLPSDSFTFNKAQSYYEFTVPNSINALDITVTTDGVYCSVLDHDGGTLTHTSGSPTHKKTITLPEGELTLLEIRAVSDRGDEGQRYTIAVTRLAKNSDASLSKLEVTIGGKPVEFKEGPFDPNRLNYTIEVPEDTTSGVLGIVAEATAGTSDVTGTGTRTFNVSGETTFSHTVKVKAEDGTEREYTITISQKPIILDSDTTITRIVISATGQPNLYDGIPAYVNYPEVITVAYPVASVNIVVTVQTATTQYFIETFPNEFNNGTLRLEVGDNTVYVYAVAQDGTNEGGIDKYEFTIRRQALIVGPDSHIKLGDDEQRNFVMSDDSQYVYTMSSGYAADKLDLSVKLDNGGYYTVTKIVKGESEPRTVIGKTESGTNASIPVDFGTNVFCINVESVDGRVKKSVVYVVERGEVQLEKLSSPQIDALQNDYNDNPLRDDFTYQVDGYTQSVKFDIDIKDGLKYKVSGPDALSIGMNTFKIEIFDGESRSLRTITVNVGRGEVQFVKLSSPQINALQNDYNDNPLRDEFTYQVDGYTESVTFDVDVKEGFRYKVSGPDALSDGMNTFKIEIIDGESRSLRTITVNVYREKNNDFWYLMFWIMVGLAAVELIVIILVLVLKKGKGGEEPAVIVSASPTHPQQPQNPYYMQGGQQNYFPPQDGQY